MMHDSTWTLYKKAQAKTDILVAFFCARTRLTFHIRRHRHINANLSRAAAASKRIYTNDTKLCRRALKTRRETLEMC